MYHSVTFGSKNSYADWHLVPDGRPVIAMPEVKTTMVEIPGSSGVLDLSESLTKYPIYSNRSGSITFHVLNDIEPWQRIYSNIATYLNGHERTLILDDDPEYYYKGRYAVEWTHNNDGTWSDVEISYSLDPYKYYFQTSVQEAPSLYKDIQVSDNTGITRHLANEWSIGTIPVVPEFIVSNVSGSGVNITLLNAELLINKTVTINSNGDYKFYDMIFSNNSGANICNLTIRGYGKVNIVFRRMAL